MPFPSIVTEISHRHISFFYFLVLFPTKLCQIFHKESCTSAVFYGPFSLLYVKKKKTLKQLFSGFLTFCFCVETLLIFICPHTLGKFSHNRLPRFSCILNIDNHKLFFMVIFAFSLPVLILHGLFICKVTMTCRAVLNRYHASMHAYR